MEQVLFRELQRRRYPPDGDAARWVQEGPIPGGSQYEGGPVEWDTPSYRAVRDVTDAVVEAIQSYRYTYRSESQLQDGVAEALTAAGLPVTREVSLSARDRIDLLVGQVGVELKIKAGLGAALTQLQRYASHPQISALVLVTTRAQHQALPPVVGGKPLRVTRVGGVV